MAEFWQHYRSEEPHLAGLTVLDPFLGGGTTLVEAARLGATSWGTDVDPLAVSLSEHQLSPPDEMSVLTAGNELRGYLADALGDLWPTSVDSDGSRWDPIHYFSLAEVECPACATAEALYRSLVVARSVNRGGAVVRDVEVHAFCPACLGLHELPHDADTLTCCGVTRSLTDSNYDRRRFVCSECGTRSSHEQLQTGAARRVLIAVEETPADRRYGGRRIRAPREADAVAERHGSERATRLGLRSKLAIPLVPDAADARPVSYGIETVDSLHSDRQLAYLDAAFGWIAEARLPDDVRRALRLAVSTTITCNNRLCGFATDYGRLAPLFSVRAFALPWLTVELNPIHASSGRGSLANAVRRVARSCGDVVRRHVIGQRRDVVPAVMNLPRQADGHRVACSDATAERSAPEKPETLADICFTDPPYFDFIPYDTLSQVFRGWDTSFDLAGTPLHPTGDDRVNAFGTALGVALRQAMASCREDALVAFTYKGDGDAWLAVGVALDEAKLRVTALWPVLADPNMGHHSADGNCEYDVLVVARPVDWTEPANSTVDVDEMVQELRRDRRVKAADVTNLRTAAAMAAVRWGIPADR